MSEKLYIKDIKKNPKDPRRRERRKGFIKILSQSIKNEGLIHPLIVNQDKTLVDGHYRLMALEQLGVEWLCWDKEKRIATLPRDKDYDTEFDSGVANFLVEPQTDFEKAIWLDGQLKVRILNNLAMKSLPTPKQYLRHVQHTKYHQRKMHDELKEWETEREHILDSLKWTLNESIDKLGMLDWSSDLQDAVDDKRIDFYYAKEVSKIKDKTIRDKLIKLGERKLGEKNPKLSSITEVRSIAKQIEKEPKSEQIFKTIFEKELDKNKRDSAFKIIEKSIEKKHLPSEDEVNEIVEFIDESEDTIKDWTDVRVDQAVEAMTEGKRLEQVEIISDADQRILNKYKSVVENIYHFNADHIRHFHSSKARNEAVNYLWTVENFVRKTLRDLNEINVMDADYVQVRKEEE